jgi:hypothetical protein
MEGRKREELERELPSLLKAIREHLLSIAREDG